MDEMQDTALFDKATEFIEARKKARELDVETEKAKKEKKKIEYELLQMMDQRELKSFKHKRFGNISATERIFGKIIDFDKVYKFFEEKGLDKEIFKLKEEKKRINKFVKEYQEKGEVLPEGLDFSIVRYIGVRAK